MFIETAAPLLPTSPPTRRTAQRDCGPGPTTILRHIERNLRQIYDLEQNSIVEQYLCSSEDVMRATGKPASRPEMLLVIENENQTTEAALFIDPTVLESGSRYLKGETSGQRFLHEACCLIEGVSHLIYLSYRSHYGYQVSELELELQAEIDKYVIATERYTENHLNVDPNEPERKAQSQYFRRALYENPRYRDEPCSHRGERYRRANQLASRFARRLELETGHLRGSRAAWSQLRRFYRKGLQQKICHIVR